MLVTHYHLREFRGARKIATELVEQLANGIRKRYCWALDADATRATCKALVKGMDLYVEDFYRKNVRFPLTLTDIRTLEIPGLQLLSRASDVKELLSEPEGYKKDVPRRHPTRVRRRATRS